MWEIIGVAIAAVALFLSFWAIMERRKVKRIKEYEERKDLKEKERELRDELRMANFRGGLTEEIANILNLKLSGYETNEEARASDIKIWNKLNKIDEELARHFNDSKKNEMSRLAQEIISFSESIRRGENKSPNSYKHIAESYDRYKKLGGNTYVDEQYKFILNKMDDEIEGES